MSETLKNILIVVGVLASVLALLTYLFGQIGPFKILIRRRASWGTVKKGILKICTWIQGGEFDPDAIIGIGRSGGIVASLVAGNLRLIPPRYIFGIIDRIFEWKEKGAIEIKLYDHLGCDLKGKKILLIDSELYTGRTMKEITEYLYQKLEVGDIKTVVLFKHAPSIFDPDLNIYNLKFPIEMPWEWTDAYKYTVKWARGKLFPKA